MTVVVNQEHPPSRLAVIVKAQDGTPIGRWAQDESSVENVFSGLTKSGEMPGGHKEMGCVLARDPKQSYPDLALFSRIEVQGAGGEVVWSGGLRQEPQSDGDHIAIEPKAVGDKQFLEDDEGVIGPGFIDGDMTKWGDPSAARRSQEALKDWHLNSNGQASLVPAGGSGETVSPAAIAHVWAQMQSDGGAELDVIESWYDSGGIDIGEVWLDFVEKGMGGGSWVNFLFAAVDNTALAETVLYNFNGISQEKGALATPNPGFKFLCLQSFFNAAFEGAGAWEGQWRGVKVLGEQGLEPQGTYPDIGFLAKQMLPVIAGLAGLTTKDELLDDDGFVIPQAWFSAPGTPMSKLIEITKYGLLDWFVFEHKILQYRFPGSYGRRWRLAPGSSAPKNSGPDANRVWDRLLVTWQDVDGTTKTAGAPGSGAMFEDSRLQITDPRNAAVAAGRPRRKLLALNGLCVESTAIRTAARFLEEAVALDQSGEATLTGYAQDENGIWFPVSYIQPGDEVADPGTQNYRKVTAPDYNDDQKSASVSLGAPPEGQVALEARFNARLIELGLGS